MPPRVIELTISFEGLDLDQLLSEWRWLVPISHRPIHLTKFGEWLFADPSGRVHHLSLIEGTLIQVAASIADYNSLKDQADKQSEWFLDGFVFRCDREGLLLLPGQCYGWRIHPMMGGKFEFENIHVFPLAVYESILGQLFRQWRQLKPRDEIPPI